MSYLHIPNLTHRDGQEILQFKTCYALEKIHGTSTHVKWAPYRGVVFEGRTMPPPKLSFFSGGASYEQFKAFFNEEELTEKFRVKFLENQEVTVYGEAYGGKQQ